MPAIVNAIHAVKQAIENFEDFIREFPASRGARACSQYITKLNWIGRDIITNPHFNEQVRQGAKEDWESDSYAIPAINEKITLLSPQKRELTELFIDALLRGEQINFEPPPKSIY